MEMYLMLNGYVIRTEVEEQVDVIVRVAAGDLSRDDFAEWLRVHVAEM